MKTNVSDSLKHPSHWTRHSPCRAELERMIDKDPNSELAKAASYELSIRDRESGAITPSCRGYST